MQECIRQLIKRNEKICPAKEVGHGVIETDVYCYTKTMNYKTKTFTYNETAGEIPDVLKKKSWNRKLHIQKLKELTGATEPMLLFEVMVNNWIRMGAIVQVREYSSKGTIEIGVSYLPSDFLKEEWNKIAHQLEDLNNKQLEYYVNELLLMQNPYEHIGFDTVRNYAVNEFSTTRNLNKLSDFFLALLKMASKYAFFDWKEIGANAPNSIEYRAPSKIFDSQRDVFCKLLSDLLNYNLESIGLTTMPGEYDLLLSARCQLHFTFGSYDYEICDVIAKVTNEQIALLESIESKDITTVFATENRAVLRKLVNHVPAARRKGIAMIGFDGQVRSTVYRFLEKMHRAGVNRIIVWSDFDTAALSMLNKLHRLEYASFEVVVFVEERLQTKTYSDAIKYLESFKVANTLIEQESLLKDVASLEHLLFSEVSG